jgi:hypothetical protein
LILALASLLGASSPVRDASSRDPLLRTLRSILDRAGLYKPPHLPKGCLTWELDAEIEDTTAYRPLRRDRAGCGTREPDGVWLMPNSGKGAPVWYHGVGIRVPLAAVDARALLVDVDAEDAEEAWEPPVEDVILSGGGGGAYKKERNGAERNAGQRKDSRSECITFHARIDSLRCGDVEVSAFAIEQGFDVRRADDVIAVVQTVGARIRALVEPIPNYYIDAVPGFDVRLTIAPSGDVRDVEIVRFRTALGVVGKEIRDELSGLRFPTASDDFAMSLTILVPARGSTIRP